MEKTLDIKLSLLARERFNKCFILADAKDADMAFGIASPGKSPEMHNQEGKYRTIHEYREQIKAIVQQGLVDIMLMSASTNDVLTIKEKVFANSAVTPAARANDATDIHVIRHGTYIQQPSQPHQTTTIDHIQCGKVECGPGERGLGANLGLYSCTFNNIPELDFKTLEAYKAFRLEAEKKGFRHFLEVFDPNVNPKIPPEKIGEFVNDHICRALAGVPKASRPAFLKIVYHGPKYMEELCHYDESIIVGILGGGSGTTYDAFKLLADAKKYGARVALYGRKINNAEHQLSFVQCLRLIADDQMAAEEGVKFYHGLLAKLNIKPYRPLAEDLKATSQAVSYGGGTTAVVDGAKDAAKTASAPASAVKPEAKKESPAWPMTYDGKPDFKRMTPAQKVAYHQAKRDKVFGKVK